MTTQTTGSHPKDLWPGVYAHWGHVYNQHQMECTDLFDFKTSEKHREELVEREGTGLAPVKGQGSPIQFEGSKQGTVNTATHVAYALGTIVTKEAIDDNLYFDQAMMNAEDLAFSMVQTKENVFAQIYNRAFNSSYTFGDGKELIATDHPTRDGTQSNELTIAAGLSEAAIEDLCTQIMLAKNSRGLRISLMAQTLHVHPNDWWEANRILESVLQNDSADNALNVLKSTSAIPGGIKVNHYFTDTNAWFIRTNAPRGMCAFNRVAAQYEQDNDFNTKNALATGYERYSGTVGDWRGIYGTPGA